RRRSHYRRLAARAGGDARGRRRAEIGLRHASNQARRLSSDIAPASHSGIRWFYTPVALGRCPYLIKEDGALNDPKQASTEYPIHELLAKRWSPCAFSAQGVPEDDLRSLFEAARWAPSSYNEQPWRYIVATKADLEQYDRLLSCLVPGNQEWAKTAPVLALGCASLRFDRNGKPNAAALHDLGLASACLTLEATS